MEANSKKAQLRKGVLAYAVLLSIKKHRAYASSILKDLKRANLIVVEGTVYPLLSRFKREKIVGYEWKESKQGPPRKYYRLTKKGVETLKLLDDTWKKLQASIKSLKK